MTRFKGNNGVTHCTLLFANTLRGCCPHDNPSSLRQVRRRRLRLRPASTSFPTYLRTHRARPPGRQRCSPDDAGQKRPDPWRQPAVRDHMGEDGAFWFTLSNSSKVARITPHGSISYSRTPSLSNPAFITPGPDGNIWFGEGSTGKIASVTPDGVITEYQFSFFGVSVGITTGSDGNIWFTDQTDHAVWRYTLSSGTFTEFQTPTPNSFPGDITTGFDGNMWFTEQAVDKFGRITPDGVITEFTGLSAPTSIAAGPTAISGSRVPSHHRSPESLPRSPSRFSPRQPRPPSCGPGTRITCCSQNSAPTRSLRSRPTEW